MATWYHREVAMVGQVRYFEIWDRNRYEAHRQQLEASLDDSTLEGLFS
jgi:DNA-binding transcriptional regulator/RsmH inhibitor MraZ